VRGGAKGATAAADVTSTANGVDHQGLDVAVQGTVTVSGTVTTTPPVERLEHQRRAGRGQHHRHRRGPTGSRRPPDGNVLATANTGRLQVDVVTGGGSNSASVGTNDTQAPQSSTQIGGMAPDGTLQPIKTLIDGTLAVAVQGGNVT
jgi:hypothetical protein